MKTSNYLLGGGVLIFDPKEGEEIITRTLLEEKKGK